MRSSHVIRVGMVEGVSGLRSERSLLQLTPLSPSTQLDPSTRPVPELRGREGQMVLVRGRLEGSTLFEASVLEILPPLTSIIVQRLLAEEHLDDMLLGSMAERAIEEIVGEPCPDDLAHPEPCCALVVEQRPGARGAVSRHLDPPVWEHDFNLDLAHLVSPLVKRANVVLVQRDDTALSALDLPRHVNALHPTFSIVLRCNSGTDPRARGSETLYFHRSPTGRKMALIAQRYITGALGLRNRHTKAQRTHDRSGHILRSTFAPCIICKPFYMTNETDMKTGLERKADLASAYASAIDEISETLF